LDFTIGGIEMPNLVKTASLVGGIIAAISLAGCATKESVARAQATADQALAQAQAAQSAAQRARGSADGGTKYAQSAASVVEKASIRIGPIEPI
jgi:hypothetical protein